MPFDRRRGSHHRTHQMRAPALALAPFEIAIRRARASARRSAARRHSCRCTCCSPRRAIRIPRRGKFCRALPLPPPLSPRANPAPPAPASEILRHVLAGNHFRRRAQILNPRIGARADEHAIERNILDRQSRASNPCRPARSPPPCGPPDPGTNADRARGGHLRHHSRIRSPGDHRRELSALAA